MESRICDHVFDAHMHIPIKCNSPYEIFKDEVLKSRLDGGLLILNGEMDAKCFWDNYNVISEGGLGFIPKIAFILDIHSFNWKLGYDKLFRYGIKYSIKIHPRVSNITINDFEKIAECISLLNSDTIIVDNWVFGPRLENHIGTELTIYLAETFRNKHVVMAHAGGVRILENMLLTRPLANVYYDLAETCRYFKNTSVYMDIIHFIKYTKKRIMFGSDFPDFKIIDSIISMGELLRMADLTHDEINDVMYGTAEKIYSGGVIRSVVEECDSAFMIGITRRDNYEQILQKMINHAEIIVVKYMGKVAGYASMYANDYSSHAGYISMFGIKREYQGKRLGTLLMDKCCSVAKECGMDTILLEVLKDNYGAYEFYSRYGFTITDRKTEYSLFMNYDLSDFELSETVG